MESRVAFTFCNKCSHANGTVRGQLQGQGVIFCQKRRKVIDTWSHPSVREGVDRAREGALFEYVGGVREDSQIRAEKAVVLQATQVNVHPATETLVHSLLFVCVSVYVVT
jgi:hypothetical protein